MARTFLIPNDEQYCKAMGCQATQLPCEIGSKNAVEPVTHHLSPSRAKTPVMRCIYCAKTQTEIEIEIEAANG